MALSSPSKVVKAVRVRDRGGLVVDQGGETVAELHLRVADGAWGGSFGPGDPGDGVQHAGADTDVEGADAEQQLGIVGDYVLLCSCPHGPGRDDGGIGAGDLARYHRLQAHDGGSGHHHGSIEASGRAPWVPLPNIVIFTLSAAAQAVPGCSARNPAGCGTTCWPRTTSGHTAVLRLLRVAARTRAEHGRRAAGPLYEAIGTQAFDFTAAPALGPEERGGREFVEPCSRRPACPPGSPAPSMTPAGTANCGRKPTRRSRWPART
jgi:hypothetical protein